MKDNLIIFGVPPTYPATGYGYIKSKDILDHNVYIANKVDEFIEKPDDKPQNFFIQDKKIFLE